VASLAGGTALMAVFVFNERHATQPITPLRLFASRERVGAYLARVLFVGAMFGQFFFLTQYLQAVRGFSPIEAGVAFLPLTLAMFATTSAVPRLVTRFGNQRVLVGGIVFALVGMVWLSRVGAGSSYLTGVAIPMIILGLGAACAFTPLTTAGVAGAAAEDAGAASGLVNVAHQLGGSLGLGVLVTVFASALPHTPTRTLTSASTQANGLAHAIATSLTVGAAMLALALAVVLLVIRNPETPSAEVVNLHLGRDEERVAA
jgi:predicted MFS family arabinose efflux permease